jgi:hypothetical protein
VAHAVTWFGVQCGILLPVIPAGTETIPPAACLSLESGKVFKLATPESDVSAEFTAAAGTLTPLKADGTACNANEPTATIDSATGHYTDFLDCSNAVVEFNFNPVQDVNIPTGDFFFVVDRLSAPCEFGPPPSCYELAVGNAPNSVHYHWERANGSPATEIFPQSGSFAQDFGFFVASHTVAPFTLFGPDGPVLAFDMTVASDFSTIEDLEINGKSVHLGELGGAHVGEARPHAVSGTSLADIIGIGMRRNAAGTVSREYSHPSSFAQGGTSYELTWEVSGGNFTGTVRQVPGGQVIPKGGQPINAENHSTAADFTAGWNWCIIGPGTAATVAAGTNPRAAGPCAPNNTVALALGSTFAIYVPGQSVYIQGLKQLPANGDKWTFLIDTGSQRGFFGREGAGPTGNEPIAPFIYNDVNDSEVERGIVNVFPGARWKLSLAGGALDLAAFDLEEIGVAPNPFIAANEIMRGRGLQRILFTNLPAVATIRIYTISGNLVRVLEHTDGTGTEEFDVRTRFDLLLASGNYYYHVTTPDGQTKLGRFAVIN